MNLNRKRFEATVIVVILVLLILVAVLSGCNVTRPITTTAQTIQRGDTTTVIMTKTIEQYDGNVDATKILQAAGK